MFVSIAASKSHISASVTKSSSPLVPRPHQQEALQAIAQRFEEGCHNLRTQCVMPCGSGKTLVAADTIARHAQGKLALLTEPSLALVAQNLSTLRSRLAEDTRYLVVCSDQSVVKANADEAIISKADLGIDVTTSTDEIKSFLNSAGPRVVISTLHSTPLLAEAYRSNKKLEKFNLAVVDEAHRTATHERSAFTNVLSDKHIPIDARVFFTATPRIWHENKDHSYTVHSMDDKEIYGDRCYELSFRKAIANKIVTDYQIVVAAVPVREVRGYQQREAVARYALFDAIRQYKLKKVLSFHSSVRGAARWSSDLEHIIKSHNPSSQSFIASVNGSMPTDQRQALIKILQQHPAKDLALLSNCRCLGEGVDVPELDGIVVCDARESELDIIQMFGRVVRPSVATGKTIGTMIIPVVVDQNGDADAVLASSEFKSVWRVVTALSSLDEGYEARCVFKMLDTQANKIQRATQPVNFNLAQELPDNFKRSLKARVVMTSMGLAKEPLSVEQISDWIKEYAQKYGKPPTQESGVIDGTNETWRGIQEALRCQYRGLVGCGYSSLFDLIVKLGFAGRKNDLTYLQIEKWIRSYHAKHGKTPSAQSGQIENLQETWASVHAALRCGYRGLSKIDDMSLPKYCETLGLSEKKEELNLKDISLWIRNYYQLNGKIPTANSGPIPDTNESWRAIDHALFRGFRGLKNCRYKSIFELCVHLKLVRHKEVLSIEQIKRWITDYYDKHERIPTVLSGSIAGSNETWAKINTALTHNLRGLKSNYQSLAKLCVSMGLKEPKDLSLAQVKSWVSKHVQLHNTYPSNKTGRVFGQHLTWSAVDQALRLGGRGLHNSPCKSLSQLVQAIKAYEI